MLLLVNAALLGWYASTVPAHRALTSGERFILVTCGVGIVAALARGFLCARLYDPTSGKIVLKRATGLYGCMAKMTVFLPLLLESLLCAQNIASSVLTKRVNKTRSTLSIFLLAFTGVEAWLTWTA